jgi:alpha-D-ribose 1-methylphosphonate 5-triphosphate diphosphatase
MTEQIFTNAKIVLANDVIDGAIQIKNGIITDISDRAFDLPGGEDLGGDYLMPGLVELHTDNLDKHLTPRPKTRWPATAAVVAHDNQVASAGITTVFDAVSIGDVNEGSERIVRLVESVEALALAQDNNLLRADHKLHLRCETSFPGMADALGKMVDLALVKMLSVMDHTPGQRQFVSLEAYYTYYQGKYGLNDEAMSMFVATRKRDSELYSAKNRRLVVEAAHARGLALASHDDATTAHVAEAVSDKMTVAEFPTTLEAARASHEAGLGVMMGGPNLVRGGSHSGNVAAGDLARNGYLDIISSDYVPHSLLHGAMKLFDDFDGYDLPRAIRTISLNPATQVGLSDRGEIAVGKRGDLIRVHHSPHHPIVRGVWREGVRVS